MFRHIRSLLKGSEVGAVAMPHQRAAVRGEGLAKPAAPASVPDVIEIRCPVEIVAASYAQDSLSSAVAMRVSPEPGKSNSGWITGMTSHGYQHDLEKMAQLRRQNLALRPFARALWNRNLFSIRNRL